MITLLNKINTAIRQRVTERDKVFGDGSQK